MTDLAVASMTDEELLAAINKHQRSWELIALLTEADKRGIWPPS